MHVTRDWQAAAAPPSLEAPQGSPVRFVDLGGGAAETGVWPGGGLGCVLGAEGWPRGSEAPAPGQK